MKCALCDSKSTVLFVLRNDREMLRCLDCKIIMEYPLPERDDYYKSMEYYYSDVDPGKNVSESRTKMYRNFIVKVSEMNGGKGRILDIGCGNGYFLELANDDGYQSYGVEVNSDLVRMANNREGLNVKCGEIHELNFKEHYFDVITMWNIFDELLDPRHYLQEVRRILRKDGILFIRVPNVDFHYPISFLTKKKNFLGVPYGTNVFHNFNFSKKGIKILLKREGFRSVNVVNSPLTTGDPYGTSMKVKLLKFSVSFVVQCIFVMSAGMITVGPSLNIYARK